MCVFGFKRGDGGKVQAVLATPRFILVSRPPLLPLVLQDFEKSMQGHTFQLSYHGQDWVCFAWSMVCGVSCSSIRKIDGFAGSPGKEELGEMQ